MLDWGKQLTLFPEDELKPPAGLKKLTQKITWVLETFEESRDEYRLVTVLVWRYFYNLTAHLESMEAFILFFTGPGIPMPKTIRERTREIQKANAHLQPRPSVKAARERKSRMRKPPGT